MGKLFDEIRSAIEPLVNKSFGLTFNETTNQAERLYSLVAKCTRGKRIDYSKRSSYLTRVYGAALSHGSGPAWHLKSWRKKPGHIMTGVLLRRQKKCEKSRQIPKKPKQKTPCGPDRHYGKHADQPMEIIEENMEELKEKCQRFLTTLREKSRNVDQIEAETIGQHENEKYKELRNMRLTASNFGRICKMRDSTLCCKTVEAILYPPDLSRNKYIMYGRNNEDNAIKKYEEERGVRVRKCGLFVDQQYPHLGASPDGVIEGHDGIVEVKCLLSLGQDTFIDAAEGKDRCYEISDGSIWYKNTEILA